jgi:tetratricopeptide (TPR) repeat protein
MMPLSLSSLRKLDDALLRRHVREGFVLLERADEDLARITPEDPLAISYLLNIAQWVDLGYRDIRLVAELLTRFAVVPRGEMKLADYLQLRLTEAFFLFASEDATAAISVLESVLTMQPEVAEPRFILMAHFWKARSHRQKGEYKLALHHVLQAKSLAQRLRAPRLIAVVQIHESWLLFQSGQRKEAFRLMDDAEMELKPTGHSLSLGNIESARGRFVRRSGEYAKALQHFQRAIAIYSEHFPKHPNLARVLVNAAYVKRLIAFDLSQKAKEGRARGALHDRYLNICREALELLERAREIYALNHHQSGTGSVLVNTGHLHLDTGDIDRASVEAMKAFQFGEEKQDHILMARARILQAAIENMRIDEQVGEADDIASRANLAAQYSEEAIALARGTQNKRLLAGAYVARGATAANEFFEEWDVAKQFASLAGELLNPDDRDHLSKELLILKSRILHAIGIDHTLRSWSDGLTGDKTFQQITEEFAEIVIPKVWMREDRKISKVAEKLSISPKKVRRILRSARLVQ